MKVMIATDGSVHAEKAAKFFCHLPHKEPLELRILAVRHYPELPVAPEMLGAVGPYYEADDSRLQRSCETIADMFDGALVEIESSIIDGHPGEVLVDTAESSGAELVVLGAIGHSMVERVLLGSVSEFVATHVKCSVLIVRNTLLDDLYDHELKICYGYDGSHRCQAAVEDISRFAWRSSMKVDIVKVLRLPQTYSDIPIPIDTSDLKAQAKQELQQAAALARGLSSNVTTHVLESDHIGEALTEFAKDNENNMLLVGDTGRGIVSRIFLGSVSRYIVREGSTSVWIGRKRA
jgi:nucleotide-binding universal stress UspA family protein